MHFKNRLRLMGGKLEPGHQAALRLFGPRGGANQLDDGVELCERFLEPFQDVGPLQSLPEIESRAPADDGGAVVDKDLEHLDQGKHARTPVHDRQHDHAERILKLRMLVEIVQDDFRLLAAFQFDDDSHPVAVRLVANVGNPIDLLVLNKARNALNGAGFVYLVGNFRNHNLLLVFCRPFDGRFGAHRERASARSVGFLDPLATVDMRSGGKVRAGDNFKNLIQRRVGPLNQQHRGIDQLGKVVRGDIGGHPDRNPGAAVGQQAGNHGRQHGRLFGRLVEVGDEIHRLFCNVGQESLGEPR